jgi:5-methylcytosine-specific restriction endonuclease McrA
MFGYEICKLCSRVFKKAVYNQKYCSIECKKQHDLVKAEYIKNVQQSRWIIYERDEFRCVYCGRSSIEDKAVLCIDHIDPYCRNFDSNIYNLITSCLTCNLSKNVKDLTYDTYNRIVKENKKRNKGISEDTQQFVSKVMELYFNKQKK